VDKKQDEFKVKVDTKYGKYVKLGIAMLKCLNTKNSPIANIIVTSIILSIISLSFFYVSYFLSVILFLQVRSKFSSIYQDSH
jgi:hypothetical protein